jgi:iron complex transport system substrate-binding protein
MLAGRLPSQPQVVALDPKTFGETIGDARTIAQLTDAREAALALVASTRSRVDVIRRKLREADRAPVPVLAVEWFDPLYIAGHWTPQLIELAGGTDVLGFSGEHSEQTTWEVVAAAQPEVVVCMPCGYDAQRSLQEAEQFAGDLRAVGARRVVAVDAAAYFSRPGPRLVDGLELLGHVLHPELVELPEGVSAPLEVQL